MRSVDYFDNLHEADATWRKQAACREVDPDLFFPVGSTGIAAEDIAHAKAVCNSCPVQKACLDYALQTQQDHGVWGGMDELELRSLRRGHVALSSQHRERHSIRVKDEILRS